MSGEVALRRDTAESRLEEADAQVREACTLLVCPDAAAMEQAGGKFRRAIEILDGWPAQASGAPSSRRRALKKSVERAGRLLEAAGRWCRHRREVLFPEETAPPCYGANGKALTPPKAGSMTLQG